MRLLRSLVVTTIVVTTVVGFAATAQAGGKAPGGKGLLPLTEQSDIQISNFECDDPTVTEILVPRAGTAAWVTNGSDRMYVLTSVSGAGTATFPGGQESYEFSQSYGNKAGKTSSLVCDLDYRFERGDFVDEGHMVTTLVRIW